ncbi:MAG: hypothetical protein A2X86_13730 [Bdellovibrionales bacterium GWA2_49_15]|nr:MAG: hypothetical protein A2X86_13730 [Bdellovibrionales bacterium GWA2_49_15]
MQVSSKLVSFLDRDNDFLIHYFEVGNLFNFLDSLHHYSPEAKKSADFFLLNFLPLIAFLKSGEHFGVYIDSFTPNLFFKLESNSSGQFRAMLLPQDFKTELQKITGQCRVNKYSPRHPDPYVSHIELADHDLTKICSEVLKVSYQTEARVLVDPSQNFSLLLSKIPNSPLAVSLDAYIEKRKALLQLPLAEWGQDGPTQLNSRNITFTCNCSREQFLPSLKQIYQQDGEALFEKKHLTITCDYCKSVYNFSREDLLTFRPN